MILVTGIHITYRHSVTGMQDTQKNKRVCRKGFILVTALRLLGFISLIEAEFQQNIYSIKVRLCFFLLTVTEIRLFCFHTSGKE